MSNNERNDTRGVRPGSDDATIPAALRERAKGELLAVRGRLAERMSEDVIHWLDMFGAIGSALQAIHAGDRAQAAAQLSAAANVEYTQCGDCDECGSVLDLLGIDEGEAGATT